MADIKLKVSRDRLSQFIKDPETLKQFERLINYMNELVPQDQTDIAVEAQEADAKAVEALSKIKEQQKETEYIEQSMPDNRQNILEIIKIIDHITQSISYINSSVYELSKEIDDIKQHHCVDGSGFFELEKRIDALEQQ